MNELLTFKCKRCEKDSHIEEIMVDCIGTSLIKSIDEDDGIKYNGQGVVDSGVLSHYQCAECGDFIGQSENDVIEWLKSQEILS